MINKELGERIRTLRLNKKLTQEELSKQLHTSISAISMYEAGLRTPDLNALIALSKFFNVTSDYLLGLSNSSMSDDEVKKLINSQKKEMDDITTILNHFRTQINEIKKEISENEK